MKICKNDNCNEKHSCKGLCKKCYDKAKYISKREVKLARQKEYNKNNKGAISDRMKKYYVDNKELKKDKRKEYYEVNKEVIKERFKKSKPLYHTWQGMIRRCNDPKYINYKYYGARGIKVCDRWMNSYDDFVSDVGEKPKGCSLDRIDVDGDYNPDNCKWSTFKEQSRNRRINKNKQNDKRTI